jgi:hypothetical protein
MEVAIRAITADPTMKPDTVTARSRRKSEYSRMLAAVGMEHLHVAG